MAAAALLYTATQKELAPEEDQGILFVLTKSPQYANLDYLEHYTDELGKVFSTVSERSNWFAINGFQGVTSGFAGILFKPWGERSEGSKTDPAGSAAQAGQRRRHSGLRLLAAGAARQHRRPAAAIRHHHHGRLSSSCPASCKR